MRCTLSPTCFPLCNGARGRAIAPRQMPLHGTSLPAPRVRPHAQLEEELTAARQDIERKGKEAQDELKQREAQLVEERNRLRGELNQVTAAVAAARAAQEAERSNWVAVKEVLQNALKDAETARAAAQDAFAASQERMSKAAEAQAQKISGLESTVEHTQQELAQLRGDLARVTAEREASSAAGAGSEAARREFENMLLSSGVVLQKTGRNGKRQTRNMRFSVAARRLEWADKVDGTWRGVSTAGATAQLEKGVLTVTTKEARAPASSALARHHERNGSD